MTDYTIAESYVLPSQGKIYNTPFNPNITLRSMTTQEEMKRLAPSELIYKNLCDVIDDCIIEKLPISCYDMCIGDYQFLIHKLRCVTYGSKYPIRHTCRLCGTVSEEDIDLENFELIDFNENCLDLLEFDLPVSKNHIKLKIQTPRILDEVNRQVKDYKKRTKGKSDVDITIVYLLCSLIESVDGKSLDPVRLEEWVRKLPMLDTNTIIAHEDKFNNSIGIDTTLAFVCDVCELEQEMDFKPGLEFFRPSIDI